jgi:hypothetical protein
MLNFFLKLRIFILSFGVPILVASVFYFILVYDSFRSLGVVFATALLIVVLLKFLLSNRKYLVKIKFSTANVEINYMTTLLKSHKVLIPLSQISEIEFTRRNWLAAYPPSLNIRRDDHWITFEVLQRRLGRTIRSEFLSRNILTTSFA